MHIKIQQIPYIFDANFDGPNAHSHTVKIPHIGTRSKAENVLCANLVSILSIDASVKHAIPSTNPIKSIFEMLMFYHYAHSS